MSKRSCASSGERCKRVFANGRWLNGRLIYPNRSASGKCMKENHACMNFPLSLSTEGAPVYEQKKLRQQRRAL